MSDTIPEDAQRCTVCGDLATVRLWIAEGTPQETRCDADDGGHAQRYKRVDLAHADAVRRAKPGGLLAVVHATARVRSPRVSDPGPGYAAWRELLGAAATLAWLARVELSGGVAPLPARLSDAEAATECARLLESVRAPGRRNHIVIGVMEFVDAAVRALGGTPGVRMVNGGDDGI